ncbi:MAG: sigma-70 family RNA polymerase sigma factor [Chitinophagaceae bacterium]|nr:sigma-70 family RNA polymerase sigma factor [Chitinophagaceae bacterium]
MSVVATVQAENVLAQIVKRCLSGDVSSEEQLYRICYAGHIRICLRYAEDMDGAGMIFNNAMLRVFKSLNLYKEQGHFNAWVKTIIIRCCLDHVAKQGRLRFDPITLNEEEQHSIESNVFNSFEASDLQLFIRSLPNTTATVFNLFIIDCYTHKEISSLLGIAEGTSKWHVNEGRKLLKQRLQPSYKKINNDI